MAYWIWMPFGVVSGVSKEMGVLYYKVEICQKAEANVGVNVGHPNVTNGEFVA